MKNIIKAILLMVAATMLYIPKSHAQVSSPANNQRKKDTAVISNRTPRINTDQPPVTETNKDTRSAASNKNNQPTAKNVLRNNAQPTTNRTPRTYTDEPPIKEVGKNNTPAKIQKHKPKQRYIKKTNHAVRNRPPHYYPDKHNPDKKDR
ncbi:MAG: hypothetical protein JST32_13870 [Bacteroidetes bacterium]|nr:hypothetical protein [Bacteroidota bacterium]